MAQAQQKPTELSATPTRDTATRDTASGGKDTIQNQSYVALKEALMSGRFLPGEVVTVKALAKMLGAGTMPVREALRRLTSEGAFEAMPNRSTRIPRLNTTQVKQILELRMELEGKAAGLAAKNMSLLQLEELQALQDKMEQLLAAGDNETYPRLNKDFHFMIYQISENEPLLALIEALWMRMAPLLAWVGKTASQQPRTLARIVSHHHRKMLKAFRARDPETACDEMRADIKDATEVPGYWDAIASITQAAPRRR